MIAWLERVSLGLIVVGILGVAFGIHRYVAVIRLVQRDRRNATQGDVKAQYIMGLRYVNADGVAFSLDKAYEWMRQAAANNHGDAIRIMAVIQGFEADLSRPRDEIVRDMEQWIRDSERKIAIFHNETQNPEQALKALTEFLEEGSYADKIEFVENHLLAYPTSPDLRRLSGELNTIKKAISFITE